MRILITRREHERIRLIEYAYISPDVGNRYKKVLRTTYHAQNLAKLIHDKAIMCRKWQN